MVKLSDREFIIAMVLSTISSILMGAFFIIALKGIDISNGSAFFTFASAVEMALVIGYMIFEHKKIAFPKKKYILNSLIFTTATILFLLLMTKTNVIVLSEIFTINILIFILFQVLHHRNIVNRVMVLKLFAGGVMIILAIMLAYGFEGISLSLPVFAIAMVITLLYGVSNYLFSHNSKHSYTKSNLIFWLVLFQLLVSSVTTSIFNFSVALTPNIIFYGLLGGVVLFLSTIIMIYSYHKIKDYTPASNLVGTSVLFVLSETDVVFISLFYGMFVGALSIYTILSLGLLVLAVYIISSVEEKIKVSP